MTDTPETAPEVLKPCPFCGSANAASVMMQHPDTFAVGCVSCRGRGPWATRDDANAAWNHRTTPEAARQDVREGDIENLRYVAAMLEAHADKFPVPEHIPPKVDMLRSVAAALSTSPLANETGALREALPADVRRLVVAARLTLECQDAETLRELDQASEAFAERVPWDDAPEGTD